jgi:hypothetical protein
LKQSNGDTLLSVSVGPAAPECGAAALMQGTAPH